jgi:hypothetical protein
VILKSLPSTGSQNIRPANECAAWKVGAAAVVITPTESMWLAGWAARRQPASGKAMDLFAKAVAFEDAGGERAVVIIRRLDCDSGHVGDCGR